MAEGLAREGWGGAAVRVGPGGGGRGTCWSRGMVGIVSKELQTFRSKEHVRREFVRKEWVGSGERMGGLKKECILCKE